MTSLLFCCFSVHPGDDCIKCCKALPLLPLWPHSSCLCNPRLFYSGFLHEILQFNFYVLVCLSPCRSVTVSAILSVLPLALLSKDLKIFCYDPFQKTLLGGFSAMHSTESLTWGSLDFSPCLFYVRDCSNEFTTEEWSHLVQITLCLVSCAVVGCQHRSCPPSFGVTSTFSLPLLVSLWPMSSLPLTGLAFWCLVFKQHMENKSRIHCISKHMNSVQIKRH